MVKIFIPEDPGGELDGEAASIRQTALGFALPGPLAARANWLLAARQASIFRGAWPTSTTAVSTRVYHHPSVNCERVIFLPVIERASSGAGTISVTPDDGGGTTVTYDHDQTAATTRWGAPSWVCPPIIVDLVDTSLQYHEVEWADLRVRSLYVIEIPRDLLDTASDTMVALRGTGYAGLEGGRMITESATAGLTDLLTGIASARDQTLRHGGGFIFPDGNAWGMISNGAWGNLFDSEFGTTGDGLNFRARRIRSATSVEAYNVRIRARYNGGTGSGDFRLESKTGADTVDFTSVTSSWAWYAPDGGATLDIATTTADVLYPKVYTTTADTTVQVASVQWIPA